MAAVNNESFTLTDAQTVLGAFVGVIAEALP